MNSQKACKDSTFFLYTQVRAYFILKKVQFRPTKWVFFDFGFWVFNNYL